MPLSVSRLAKLAPLFWATIAAAALYVLVTHLEHYTLADITAALDAVPFGNVAASLVCCFLAFVVLAVYEIIAVHAVTGRWLKRTASTTAVIANGIGHVIGAAVLSGSALRYRCYAAIGLSAKAIGAVTLHTALPYVLAAGWLVDIALLAFASDASQALKLPISWVIALGVAGLVKDVGWIFLVARRRSFTFGSWTLPLPTVRFTCIQIIAGTAEILLVASILYLFMPPELNQHLLAFTGVFVLAATAAQLSHVPAGIGVLEAALIVLLPHVPAANLIAAVLCFRAVFELLPLVAAVALLLRSEWTSRRARRDAGSHRGSETELDAT